MVKDRLEAFFTRFKSKHAETECCKARTLLIIQLALAVLLAATMLLVCFLNNAGRMTFYLLLTAGLAVPLVASLVLNIKGHYKSAAWLAVLTAVVGPWLCVLADDTIARGDFVPLVYMALSIQLCAILLTERVTLIVGLLQFGGLAALIMANPGLQHFNWPSVMAFIVFTGTLGIVTSLLNRRQLEQIEKDRSLLKESEAKMQELAVRDSLTGLFNRRYMEETLEREISRAQRESRCLGVIMTDVDEFKTINDTFGHALGDEMLSYVANSLMHNIRKSDIACRFGGDEFILIMPECSLEDTVLRAQGLRRIVESESIVVEGQEIGHVTLSMGVAAMPEHGTDSGDLLKAADKALYVAKEAGRNRVVTARVAMAQSSSSTA